MRTSILLLATPALLLGSCTKADKPAATPVDPQAVMDAIHKTEAGQIAALNANDLAGATAVYADNAVLYVPDGPAASGSEAIKATFVEATKDKAYKVVPDDSSHKSWVAQSGEIATTAMTGQFTRTVAGQVKTDPFVNQTVWAKQPDGSWKIESDLNAVVPAAPATAAEPARPTG